MKRGRCHRGRVLVIAAALLAAAVCAAADSLTSLDQRISELLEQGQVQDARDQLAPALRAARALSPDGAFYASYLDSLGIRFFQAGGDSIAVALLERGVAVRDSVFGAADVRLAPPLELLATAYYIVGRVADAVPPQERALLIRTASLGADNPSTAACRYDLALVYYRLARYDDAEAELRASLAVREQSADTLAVAETERVLGEVCREKNRYGEAETRMQRALGLARAALPTADARLVTFLNSLAGFYRDQARYDECEYLIEEAVDIRTRAGLEDQLATPTLNLAEVYRYQGRYDDALPLYQQALELATRYLSPLVVAEFHNQLAAAYAEAGRLDDASREYEQALAIVRDSPHASGQVVAQFEHDYGALLFRLGRDAEARRLLEDAIARREAVFGPSHPLVAVSLTELARQAMSKPAGRAEATALLDRAIAILDSSDAEPESEADARAVRAELFRLQQQDAAAIAEMARALDIVETLRPHRGGGAAERIAFMGRYRGYYEAATAWEVDAGNVADALAYSERMRARVLTERLMRADETAAAPSADAALERLRSQQTDLERRLETCQAHARGLRAVERSSRAQREELARTETACDAIVEDLQRARDRLERAAAGQRAPETRGNDDVPAAAGRAMPPGGAFLVYHTGASRSFVFVLRAGEKPRCTELFVTGASAGKAGAKQPVTRALLTRVLNGFDESGRAVGRGVLPALSEPPVGGAGNPVVQGAQRDLEGSLAALFTMLVPEPVWKEIRPLGEVVVIPDGPLFALPFEALVTSRGEDGARLWLDDGPALRYAPSIAMLDALGVSPAPHSPPRVLSVCNPRFAGGGEPRATSTTWLSRTRFGDRGGSLEPLPGTERETEDLVRRFGANAVTVLRGGDATERAVCGAVAGKDVIHLATHGLVSQRRSDLLAALALTPVSVTDLDDDGFLQMFEIYRLRLSARLVVLSACESSRGSFVEGEGVMALSNGFHAAGAREVVATLWKVDDEASAALVEEFLGRAAGRWDTGGDVARALRDAKRVVRAGAGHSHPFYWAAFVVSGRP